MGQAGEVGTHSHLLLSITAGRGWPALSERTGEQGWGAERVGGGWQGPDAHRLVPLLPGPALSRLTQGQAWDLGVGGEKAET